MKKFRRNILLLIGFGLLMVAIPMLIFFAIVFLRGKIKQGAWRQHNIDSFAGCFNESKASWKSYQFMTEEEIEGTLKALDISQSEFLERKKACGN